MLICLLAAPATAHAAEPRLGDENTCAAFGGQGDPCTASEDCAANTHATICVQHSEGGATVGRCEIPCQEGEGAAASAARAACAVGETCVHAQDAAGQGTRYCKLTRFRVDLNLLDRCIVHHLEGVQPGLGARSECSLEANLDRLLDQDGNLRFDIFDLDLCIVAFLEQPSCSSAADCPEDLVFCSSDEDCGLGLYCDSTRHTCQRDCGLIPSREPEVVSLDRECSGSLQVCERGRGRCVQVDVTRATCEVDRDCPAGAYCFLGRCAPHCYRAVECPDTDWSCTRNNRCRPLPPPAPSGGFVFEPKDYAVRFARDSVSLDAIEDKSGSPLVILDILSRRQVVDNPAVGFGYRMEITYNLKSDVECLRPFVDCSDPLQRAEGEEQAQCEARQEDCLIDASEEWIRPLSPFGTVSASGNPYIEIALERAVAESLTPGTYTATVRAIFDNGDTDTLRVSYVKPSPSGEYTGDLTVYYKTIDTPLTGLRPLQVGMRLKVLSEESEYLDGQRLWRWNNLLARFGVREESGKSSFVDVTRGEVVYAQLHGGTAFAFAQGGATTAAENEIPFIGLYSPDMGYVRLVGVVEIEPDFCIAESGPCTAATADELEVHNLFGRKIRRQIELTGPFEEAVGRFHGVYREKISGLASDFDLTLEGIFILDQVTADDSSMRRPEPLLPLVGGSAVEYPDDAAVTTALDTEISTYCAAGAPGSGGDVAVSELSSARDHFRSSTDHAAYLRSFPARASETEITADRVLSDLRSFSEAVEEALSALDEGTPAGRQDELNIFDFLSNRVLPCDDTDPSPPPVCIDEAALRCGLALHQKALINRYVNVADVAGDPEAPTTGELDLFCVDTIPVEGCPANPRSQKALFTMQEHNRFWRGLAEVRKFAADRGRSDAFMVLFRNEVSPFTHGAALSFKEDRLRDSMRRYDDLVRTIVGPAAGKVLYRWPARAFKSAGNDWLKTMQTILDDRMDTLAELVDLKRRIFLGSDASDFMFAQHMMQQELLIQVYLIALQERWQQELFAYRGEAERLFEKGQQVLNQLNPNKNRIGVTPNRVFFENSDPERSNWESYHDTLVGVDGDGGLLAHTREIVHDAVANLKDSLRDLDTFEEHVRDSRHGLQDRLNELCGDSDPSAPAGDTDSYCQYLLKQYHDYRDWEKVRDCKFGSDPPDWCPGSFHFTCGSVSGGERNDDSELKEEDEIDLSKFNNDLTYTNNCDEVINTFIAGTGGINEGTFDFPDVYADGYVAGGETRSTGTADPIANQPTCLLNRDEVYIDVNGAHRPCVGGRMGQLLQEKALLQRQRNIVVGSLETEIRKLRRKMQRQIQAGAIGSDLRSNAETMSRVFDNIESAIQAAEILRKALTKVSDIPNCVVVVGFSVGTSCGGSMVRGITQNTLEQVIGMVQLVFKIVKDNVEISNDRWRADREADVGRMEIGEDIFEIEREVDPLIDEYNVLTQQEFNVGTQIEDTRYQAQAAADRFRDEVTFVADHLVGRETGNALLGDHLVGEAAIAFREIVDYAYRMTVAYAHELNLPAGETNNLVNQALSLVTLDEVAGFARMLRRRTRDYCGLESIDCDSANNVEVLRYSIRDQVFPQLVDVVDARTGKVVTAGEQFHNIVTSPPYLRRRVRGVHLADQIELNVSIPVTLQESRPGGPAWLIDPLTCNHLLDARDPAGPLDPVGLSGTVALNVVARNTDEEVKEVRYELIRGAVDFIRSCHPESVVEEVGTLPVLQYPIRKHIIGYAPQSDQGRMDSPPSYVSRSASFSACLNQPHHSGKLQDAPCWRFFSRDRSLASSDWKLVIPLHIGGGATANTWILGEGLPADQRPVVEDLVLYFRYRARPIQEY